jgi:hypothetical protein
MDSNLGTAQRSLQSMPIQSIVGKTVVIAGDVAGIGLAATQLLVENGAKVFIAVNSPAELLGVFTEMAKTGGQWDGIAVNLSSPMEVQRLFDQAEHRLGRIDIFINALAPALIPVTSGAAAALDAGDTLPCQYVSEAIQRMRGRQWGNVVHIRLPGQLNLPTRLRRDADENGIRMTVIEQGTASVYGQGVSYEHPRAEDVARCIYESLVQPFRMDVILLHG